MQLNFSDRSEDSKANWISEVNLKLEDTNQGNGIHLTIRRVHFGTADKTKSGKGNPGTRLSFLLSMEADYRKSG